MCSCSRTEAKPHLVTVNDHQITSIDIKNAKCALHLQTDNLTTPCRPQTPLTIDPSTSIRIDHPLKILWDICTILLSLTAGVYTTHAGVRDKCFPHLLNNQCASKTMLPLFFGCIPGDWVVTFLDLWCVADIVLNFLIEDKTKSRAGRSYLKTWFLVDVISMLSWEVIFVQPVFYQKKTIIERTIDLCRVLPLLKKRWHHLVRICLAVKAARCRPSSLCCFIRFAPKYIVFTLRMKMVLVLRVMRHVRLQRRLFKNLTNLCFISPSPIPAVVSEIQTVAAAAA
jgi:hypothetical protein